MVSRRSTVFATFYLLMGGLQVIGVKVQNLLKKVPRGLQSTSAGQNSITGRARVLAGFQKPGYAREAHGERDRGGAQARSAGQLFAKTEEKTVRAEAAPAQSGNLLQRSRAAGRMSMLATRESTGSTSTATTTPGTTTSDSTRSTTVSASCDGGALHCGEELKTSATKTSTTATTDTTPTSTTKKSTTATTDTAPTSTTKKSTTTTTDTASTTPTARGSKYSVADFTGEQGPGTAFPGATWDKPFSHNENTPNSWPNKCSHTGSGSDSDRGYWFVQFAKSGEGVVPKKHVHKVRLWNRADVGTQERLNKACVRYSYDGTKPSNNPLDGKGCDARLPATVKSNTGPGSGTELMINKEITGMMIIAMETTATNHQWAMTICGIEIYR